MAGLRLLHTRAKTKLFQNNFQYCQFGFLLNILSLQKKSQLQLFLLGELQSFYCTLSCAKQKILKTCALIIFASEGSEPQPSFKSYKKNKMETHFKTLIKIYSNPMTKAITLSNKTVVVIWYGFKQSYARQVKLNSKIHCKRNAMCYGLDKQTYWNQQGNEIPCTS